MKLKTKSLLSVTLMTVVVSAVVGYITIQNSNEILQNNLQREIQTDTKKIKNHIAQIKTRLKTVSGQVSQNQTVIASLNLIANYQDKTAYNALIFDEEKTSLLEYSQRFFSRGQFFTLSLYEASSALAVRKSFHNDLPPSGYVSYKNGSASFQTSSKQLPLDKDSAIDPKCIGNVVTSYENGYYKLCYNTAVKRAQKTIGYVKTSYYFGPTVLKDLQQNLIYPVSFVSKNADKHALDISVLDKELGLYLKHDIDFSYMEQKREELIETIIFVVIVLTVLMFLMFTGFIKKEVLGPLQKLQDTLESMLKKQYTPIRIRNNDEIGRIFQASNRVFEKFWESYSALQGYRNSVETSNLVTKTDLKGKITYANELFCTTSGYTKKEVEGKPHNIVRHPDMPKEMFKTMWQTIKRGQTWRGTIKNKTKNGGFYWTDAVVTPIYNTSGHIEGYISIRRDITELMNSKNELEYRANYDQLTGLKNRTKLHADLAKMRRPALVLINIDRFSQINDFYGHGFGDKLLNAFAGKLYEKFSSMCVHEFTLYRYGGDEFALLVQEYDKKRLTDGVEGILQDIENTAINVQDKMLNLNLSSGIAFEDAHDALLSADMALKLSKKEKRSPVVYSRQNSLEKQYENNLLWAAKLKTAIEEDRVVPFFQPIVNNSSLAYEKYESLVRIIESDGKVISPFFFLDIAKQTKQYHKLTQIMIDKSFAAFAGREADFSINLSMEDISSSQMREFLYKKLDAHPDMAQRLVFELVESESMDDYDAVITFINTVKEKGCKIAIDDFGSGYSNFEYLIKLQADFIKIDGSLIKHINTQKASYIVVSTIVSFAKQMGIKTIGEFIENEEILQTTKELGIDYSQGYHFSAPKQDL